MPSKYELILDCGGREKTPTAAKPQPVTVEVRMAGSDIVINLVDKDARLTKTLCRICRSGAVYGYFNEKHGYSVSTSLSTLMEGADRY